MRVLRIIRLFIILKNYKNFIIEKRNSKLLSKKKINSIYFPDGFLNKNIIENKTTNFFKTKEVINKNILVSNSDKLYTIPSHVKYSESIENTGNDMSVFLKLVDKNIHLKNNIRKDVINNERQINLIKDKLMKSDNELNNKKKVVQLPEKLDLNKKEEIITNTIEDIDCKCIENELKITKRLSHIFTKKVFIILILILLVVPLLDSNYWDTNLCFNYKSLMNYIYYFSQKNSNEQNFKIKKLLKSLAENKSDPQFPLINITLGNELLYSNKSFTQILRNSEIGYFSTSDNMVIIIFSIKRVTYLTAIIGLVSTIFIAFILSITIMILERDLKNLIFNPLEEMMEIVERLARNPMIAKNKEKLKSDKAFFNDAFQNNKGKKKKYDFQIIKSAIIRISDLLILGFGEAGGQIIKENLNKNNEFRFISKGRKKLAIFGFCDIRDFSKVNIALEQDIMIFINEVAKIVHSSIDKFYGETNKNIGEAFLSVWKVNKKEKEKNCENGPSTNVNDNSKINYLDELSIYADNSLLSFLDIIKKIKNYNYKLDHSKNNNIHKKFGNFQLKMGFGLHYGWAIEGTIGSIYKIDASYLSPNVNLAARLESATKIYDVSILISGETFDIFSNEIKNICRLIDIVTVKGSVNPIRIYTVDINNDMKVKYEESNKFHHIALKEKVNFSKLKNILKKPSFNQLLNVKRSNPEEFKRNFSEGITNYLNGSWKNAAYNLHLCNNIDNNDGPTKFLLGFMNKFSNLAPESWQGYRELTSK